VSAGISLALALLVASADYRLADSCRAAAQTLHRTLGPQANGLRFQGHWGFQYYMERLGAKALDRTKLDLRPGEAVIIPLENSFLFLMPADLTEPWCRYQVPISRGLAVMSGEQGAGYYSDAWGPLPFVFCPGTTATYLVQRVKAPAKAQ